MSKTFIIILMIFLHIVDDYYLQLQGWLASGKQKSWWKENAPDEMYKYDYIWALAMHSFSWAFMTVLPIAVSMKFEVNGLFVILLFLNMLVHGIVDDLKANKKRINLWQDQIIHIMQIVITAIVLIGV